MSDGAKQKTFLNVIESLQVREELEAQMGRQVVDSLNDPNVSVVECNADGQVWIDFHVGSREPLCAMGAGQAEQVVRLVAKLMGRNSDPSVNPRVAGMLSTGEKFDGLVPTAGHPSFSIVKPSPRNFLEAIRDARERTSLETSLGASIVAALDDPDVVEILANPDGGVWKETHSEGRKPLCGIESYHAESVVRMVAHRMGTEVSPEENPQVSGVLPTGERFHGLIPPIVDAAAFTIRKRSLQVFTLDDYVASGTITPRQRDGLKQAIRDRKNILVVGGTGSGKTTLCNALLADEGFVNHRVVIIEDTRELQCSAKDSVAMLSSRSEPTVTMRDLLKATMRMRPDRIVVGEVRGGEALDLIKSWNTGHPGGLGTLHADGALAGLKRVESLIAEVSVNVDREAVGDAIDFVVSIRRTARGREVDEILEVERFDPDAGRYVTRPFE